MGNNNEAYVALKLAAEKFIDKVDTGKARSKETYKELKDALALIPEPPKPPKEPETFLFRVELEFSGKGEVIVEALDEETARHMVTKAYICQAGQIHRHSYGDAFRMSKFAQTYPMEVDFIEKLDRKPNMFCRPEGWDPDQMKVVK